MVANMDPACCANNILKCLPANRLLAFSASDLEMLPDLRMLRVLVRRRLSVRRGGPAS